MRKMSVEGLPDSPAVKSKPKKKSLVERELETSLSEKFVSPVTVNDKNATSRYGRARRLKTDNDYCNTEIAVNHILKSPQPSDKISQQSSPVYRMHASNSPCKKTPVKLEQNSLDNQIENIYNENILMSRFSNTKKEKTSSPARSPKIYIRKDLIQRKEKEETITLIKNIFSPVKSPCTSSNTNSQNYMEKSSEKYNNNKSQNGHLNMSSVVKTLDFDGNKKRKRTNNNSKQTLSKSDIFEMEAKCAYQVGDLAWARMGTYPFWPCIVTRDPVSGMFVKKKLFGRIERDIVNVTFFGDNGRHSWVVDNMLRRYHGKTEFLEARERFSVEDKKKDPRLYAAFFISEKKQALWNTSVDEAESLMKEPKRLRIDLFNTMLWQSRSMKVNAKRSSKVTRTDSDVSLSESLFDTLFSEDDVKDESLERSIKKQKNKALDVSDVVTACLDNMAAKTGITKIQRQSHMDRWLQKAKSKTPEKTQTQNSVDQKSNSKSSSDSSRVDRTSNDESKSSSEKSKSTNTDKSKKTFISKKQRTRKSKRLSRKSQEDVDTSITSLENEHDYSSKFVDNIENQSSVMNENDCVVEYIKEKGSIGPALDNFSMEENLPDEVQNEHNDVETSVVSDDLINHDDDDLVQISNGLNALESTNEEKKTVDNTINTSTTKFVNGAVSDKVSDVLEQSNELTNKIANKNKDKIAVSVTKTDGSVNQPSPINSLKDENNEELSEKTDFVQTQDDLNTSTETFCDIEMDENTPKKTSKDEMFKNKDIVKPVNRVQPSPSINLDANYDSDYSTKSYSVLNKSFDKIFEKDKLSDSVSKFNENEIISEKSINNSVSLKSQTTSNTIIKSEDKCQIDVNIPKLQINDLCKEETNDAMDVDQVDNELTASEKPCEIPDTTEVNKTPDNGVQVNETCNGGPNKNDANSKVLLDLQNTELAITEGRVTSSPFEFTNNDKFSKESSPDLHDFDSESINSENSEIPLSKLVERKTKDFDTASIKSNSSTSSVKSYRRKQDLKSIDLDNLDISRILEEPDFRKYFELRQDQILDENPELSADELVKYLYKTWIYEESSRSDKKITDEFDGSSVVKGLGQDKPVIKPKRKVNKLHSNVLETISTSSEDSESISKRSLRSRTNSPSERSLRSLTSSPADLISKDKIPKVVLTKIPNENNVIKEIKEEIDPEIASIDSENSDIPLIQHKVNRKRSTEKKQLSNSKTDDDSHDSKDETEKIVKKRYKELKSVNEAMESPEFLKYLEVKQDALIEEHPELSQDEIVFYLYKTWLYEEGSTAEINRIDELEHENLVKGLNTDVQPTKPKKKAKTENKIDKYLVDNDEIGNKDKPKRKTVQPYYNEEFDDFEDEIQYFEIFSKKQTNKKVKSKVTDEKDLTNTKDDEVKTIKNEPESNSDPSSTDIVKVETESITEIDQNEVYDEVEMYFHNLTKPKPNLFKGLARERVCEICERPAQLAKCKGCHGMFHPDCLKKETEIVDSPAPTRGRKKKKKPRGRRPKNLDDSIESEGNSDEKPDLNVSEEFEEPSEPMVVDFENFETQFETKMKEIMDENKNPYTNCSSNLAIDWSKSVAGNCELIDITPIPQPAPIDSEFKCNNCQKSDVPICFVCKSPVSPKSLIEDRQSCQLQHCHKYYHRECLDPWPQTQFSQDSKKKVNEHFESFTCPRHVCHTCVCDDPRGCKTRFSADKLARCVRCPATYHTFTKCLPAGTQILTGSHIICPRHYEHRPGKVPCHVNTGWCFICALGGILICCEYCPTSFHAECLNIKPPEGGYMCEDCETGRLPLYGEMVWVKLGHYRWWPGIILHPSEVPSNIMSVRHSPGEFVVRFFGQYDHYWVNRGRVFPFQEGDSGRVSSQKSKIDAAFTTAMEHAQRACEILKNAQPNPEESDIASSLLPPHFVKLKVNKPIGGVSRRNDLEEGSLTQCECDPNDVDPCGPYSHCLNRMLLTECGSSCRAGERCQNRVFERRLYPRLVPYRTPHRGWGLKTLEDIKMGQFVIEYVGELIDEEEFRRRMAKMHEVRDENFYFLTLDKERMIDAGPKGNLARFMNHCCEPNCETQKWTVLGDVRVGLFALKDIPANSEVTFNYNLECAGIDKKKCMCGAKRCSGYIGAKPKQDESQPKKLKRVYRKRPKPAEESPSTVKTKPKPRNTSRGRPRELTDIEKDLLIIKNATNGLSSDSEVSKFDSELSKFDSELSKCDSELSKSDCEVSKPLKRKRVSFSTDNEVILINGDVKSPSVKRFKIEDEKVKDVGD